MDKYFYAKNYKDGIDRFKLLFSVLSVFSVVKKLYKTII